MKITDNFGHQQVLKECPELTGHLRKIDDALIDVLIQAKQYIKRKVMVAMYTSDGIVYLLVILTNGKTEHDK